MCVSNQHGMRIISHMRSISFCKFSLSLGIFPGFRSFGKEFSGFHSFSKVFSYFPVSAVIIEFSGFL